MSGFMADGILRGDELVQLRLRGFYERMGYKKFSMVKFEEYDFYAKNMDFLKDKRLITFTGATGRLMALRPDVTMSIAKKVRADMTGCEKLYYTENVYRASSARDEFREWPQIGVELIGRVSPCAAVEVIFMALESLALISGQYILDISHEGFISGALACCGDDLILKKRVRRLLEEKNAHELLALADIIGQSAAESLAALMRLPEDFAKALDVIRALDIEKSAVKELDGILRAAAAGGLASRLRLDFSIASDEQYYNGIVFQGYVEGTPKAVLHGGRYDLLLEKMGKPGLEAIGFAIYMGELERGAPVLTQPDTAIIYAQSSDSAKMLLAAREQLKLGRRIWTGTAVPEGFAGEVIYISEVAEDA